MIVLDEQLLGRAIDASIAAWYPGAVTYITDLRPHSVIKDDAIPALLRNESQPTFITINTIDFWQKTSLDSRFCIICFALSDSRIREIPSTLRRILQHAEFDTKAKRMGHMIRVSDSGVAFYNNTHQQTRTLDI